MIQAAAGVTWGHSPLRPAKRCDHAGDGQALARRSTSSRRGWPCRSLRSSDGVAKGCVIGQLLLAQAPSRAPLAPGQVLAIRRVGADGAALECCVSDAMAVIVSRFAPPDHPKCLRSHDLPGHRRHDRCCGTWGSYHLVHRSLLCSRFVLLPPARRVLWLDAASGLGMCLSHGLGGTLIAPWMGIPAYVLQLAALIVLAAASLAAWLASRPQLPSTGVRFLALGNFVWVGASAWLVWGSGMALTPLGQGLGRVAGAGGVGAGRAGVGGL